MSRQIDDELQKFAEGIKELRSIMNVEEIAEYAYTLKPKEKTLEPLPPKSLGLVVSGIVHGNETVGIAVINEFISLLASETIDCGIPLGIFLGNPPAALANKRFLLRDLNRSFDRSGHSAEERRARELLPILAEAMWYLDLHQTNRPAEEPFFIFPYTSESFAFAQNLSAHTPIVTHIHSSFSKDGQCTDEYVNSHGGAGLTLECGQAGFDPLQVGFGLKTVLHAVRFVHNILEKDKPPHPARTERRKIYVVKDTIACPQDGIVKLREKLINLQSIEKGELLAMVDGHKILSPRSGRIIFPNYSAETAAPGQRPAELMRVVEEISAEDLKSSHH